MYTADVLFFSFFHLVSIYVSNIFFFPTRYFGSAEEEKENEELASNSISCRQDSSPPSAGEAIPKDLDSEKDDLKSPPPSKRTKTSFIQYLDSHSKNSLKRAAAGKSDSESGLTSPVCDLTTSQDELEKKNLSVKHTGDGSVGQPLLPTWPGGMESTCKESEFRESTLLRFVASKKPSVVEKDGPKIVFSRRMALFKAFGNAKISSQSSDEAPENELQGSQNSGISPSQDLTDDSVTPTQLSQGVHSQIERSSVSVISCSYAIALLES